MKITHPLDGEKITSVTKEKEESLFKLETTLLCVSTRSIIHLENFLVTATLGLSGIDVIQLEDN